MDADFWHERWNSDRIGFHQDRANKRLAEHWPTLEIAPSAAVFVPLCGKSLDMLWLREQGHAVFGIELSEKAVGDFFAENGLQATRRVDGPFDIWSGLGRADGIHLLVGDFFLLEPERLISDEIAAVYDRAAMIAMNEALRPRYAKQLGRIMPPGSDGLVIAIDYDQSRMSGPPFAVTDDAVHELLGEDFDMETLAHYSGAKRLGNLADRGLDSLDERVYRVQRRES